MTKNAYFARLEKKEKIRYNKILKQRQEKILLQNQRKEESCEVKENP